MNASRISAKKSRSYVRGSIGTRIADAIIYVAVGLVAASMLAPFLYILAGSFATEKELTERAFFIIPREISLNAYEFIIQQGSMLTGLQNSIIVTVLGTIFAMTMSTVFAYPLSKPHFQGRKLLLNLVIFTMLFSGGMIPSFILIRTLGWLDSHLALIIPGAISAWNMIIIKNFLQDLPIELEEASRIDGANEWQTFTKICLPLSKPVLASIGLFYAVSLWNDYFSAMIYLNDNKKYTVQLILRQIITMSQQIQTDGIDWGNVGAPPDKVVRMASTIVATVPILMIYPFLQKYFAKGIMVGSVKG